ncbi:MAG: flagellar assembly peptidoglycan hydrolase FlgJ [Pseudomonadota bacterium]
MNTIPPALFTDPAQLAELKHGAREGEDDNLREVARQFESLFTHMLFKNMRAASLADGVFDSDQTRFYEGMFDQQMALELSKGSGLGIADMLVRQLSGLKTSEQSTSMSYRVPRRNVSVEAATPPVEMTQSIADKVLAFVQSTLPHAKRVGERLGVAPQLIMAQAALESGWGRKQILNSDGSPTHNLFGIKASKQWDGATAMVKTYEYSAGIPRKVSAAFRSYSSMFDSFNDYASLLLGNSRYAAVVGSGNDSEAFAQALQEGGYATDPEYANKIIGIVNSEALKSAMHLSGKHDQR